MYNITLQYIIQKFQCTNKELQHYFQTYVHISCQSEEDVGDICNPQETNTILTQKLMQLMQLDFHSIKKLRDSVLNK